MVKVKRIAIPVVILAIGFTGLTVLHKFKRPPEQKTAQDTTPKVNTKTLKAQPTSLDVTSYGLVKPKYQTELVAQISGQVVSISDVFLKGQHVKKGTVLARIESSDYQAALLDAQANLAKAKASFEIEQAQSKVAKSEWQRLTKSTGSMLSPELYLRKPQLAEKVARLKAAEAALKRAQRNLERTYIKAPYDALITRRNISLGAFLNKGSKLGMLNAIKQAQVRLPVSDSDLQFLSNHGIGTKVTLKAQFAGQDYSWQAHIVRSEGIIDEMTRMTYLVAEINNPYGYQTERKALRFGTYVTAIISGKQYQSLYKLPNYAVNNDKVLLLNQDDTLIAQKINIIRENNGFVYTDTPVLNGLELITTVLDYPTQGMKLSRLNPTEADKSSIKKDAPKLALKEE